MKAGATGQRTPGQPKEPGLMTAVDRRTFLAAAVGVAAAPCCPFIGGSTLEAQAAKWIDLHHHFAPPA